MVNILPIPLRDVVKILRWIYAVSPIYNLPIEPSICQSECRVPTFPTWYRRDRVTLAQSAPVSRCLGVCRRAGAVAVVSRHTTTLLCDAFVVRRTCWHTKRSPIHNRRPFMRFFCLYTSFYLSFRRRWIIKWNGTFITLSNL